MRSGKLCAMEADAIEADGLPVLPRRLQRRMQRMEQAHNLDRQHDEALHLMQDTLLYLASLAFADYRARAPTPSFEVERMLLRWKHAWLGDYGELLLHALRATPSPLLTSRERRAMRFPAAARLRTAMRGLDAAVRGCATRAAPIVDEMLLGESSAIGFNEMRATLTGFRNKAYAHVDRTHWDRLDDYLAVVAPLLVSAADELVNNPLVRRMLGALHPATIVAVGPLDDDGCASVNARLDDGVELGLVADERRFPDSLAPGRFLLLAPDTVGGFAVHGAFWSLLENDDVPTPLANEVVGSALACDELEPALRALEAFLLTERPDVDPNVDPKLVDTAIVLVLEHYKTTCEPPYHEWVGRLDGLLDHQSSALPDRLTEDVEYFTAITVERPIDGGPSKASEAALLAKLASPRRVLRCVAADAIGYLDTPTARLALEQAASCDPRRAVRKHALYGLARMAKPESWDVVTGIVRCERNDPELAAHALNALGAFQTAETVAFLFGFLRTGMVYPCMCAAASSVAALALNAPETLVGHKQELLELIAATEDAYTRGCLVFVLSSVGDADDVAVLLQLVGDDRRAYVQEDLCLTLGMIGDDRAVPFLAHVLCREEAVHADCVVQRQAVLALRRIDTSMGQDDLQRYDPPQGFPIIVRALNESLA
ncbi:MAG TPA: HEAT repeat domain-containing protein [Conexibacter sp.]|nr:HEAT repeat domain-containing protein [Conexibacter sp.]